MSKPSKLNITYYVVEFVCDRTVEVVPSTWMFSKNTKSHWPNETDSIKLNNLVKAGLNPLENTRINWSIYDCKVLIGSGKLNQIIIIKSKTTD